mmetsp:Transcript_27568/g.64091  ORF Transcript_27568/g.64091 Transcript_27568/m.64091 type:complete len:227 (-) Transcript_27568:34-714(-)
MVSSMVPAAKNLNTLTCRRWPIRNARSCACKSWLGFQLGSTMMTVFALVRLMPRPPAFVDRSMMKMPLSELYSLTSASRLEGGVLPSSLRKMCPEQLRKRSTMLRKRTDSEKMSTLAFLSVYSLARSFESICSLPHSLLCWNGLHDTSIFSGSSVPRACLANSLSPTCLCFGSFGSTRMRSRWLQILVSLIMAARRKWLHLTVLSSSVCVSLHVNIVTSLSGEMRL